MDGGETSPVWGQEHVTWSSKHPKIYLDTTFKNLGTIWMQSQLFSLFTKYS
jgi:hypothetical protein